MYSKLFLTQVTTLYILGNVIVKTHPLPDDLRKTHCGPLFVHILNLISEHFSHPNSAIPIDTIMVQNVGRYPFISADMNWYRSELQ